MWVASVEFISSAIVFQEPFQAYSRAAWTSTPPSWESTDHSRLAWAWLRFGPIAAIERIRVTDLCGAVQSTRGVRVRVLDGATQIRVSIKLYAETLRFALAGGLSANDPVFRAIELPAVPLGDPRIRPGFLFITVEEAACALKRSPRMVAWDILDGRIPALRMGRRTVIPRPRLERILGRAVEPPALAVRLSCRRYLTAPGEVGVPEATAILRVCEPTLLAAVRKGVIPCIPRGKCCRFALETLADLAA